MSLPINYDLDMDTQKWVSVSNFFLDKKFKPSSKEVIFIDVSKSRYLVPFNEDSSENEILVNRRYLAELFKYIVANDNNIKYLFADIIFDFSTIHDDSLVYAANALGNKFLSINTYNENGLFQKNILGLPSATATITMQDDVIYKVPLIGSYNDTFVPLKIYSDIHKIKFKHSFLFTWFENKGISFNSQINDLYLRRKDFIDGEYIKIGLGELISLIKVSPDFFKLYLKDRFIIMPLVSFPCWGE